MRVSISREGKKNLVLEGDQMALQAPSSGAPLMIEAVFDDGSPLKILIGNGEPVPVRQMRLVHKDTYRVKSFIRRTSAGEVRIPSHDRRKPYRKLRSKHVSI